MKDIDRFCVVDLFGKKINVQSVSQLNELDSIEKNMLGWGTRKIWPLLFSFTNTLNKKGKEFFLKWGIGIKVNILSCGTLTW